MARALTFDQRIAAVVEERLALRVRHGFGPASIGRDRAEATLCWERGDFRLRLTFYGVDTVKNPGLGFDLLD